MKRIVLLAMATLLAGCVSPPKDSIEVVLDDEGQIIANWVDTTLTRTPQKLVLVLESTVEPGLDYAPTETMFKGISINGQPLRVDKTTIASFQNANTTLQRLRIQLSFAVPHNILTGKELHAFFQKKDGWKDFNKRYPESHGYFSFARVGFNQGKTEALLYVEQYVGWLHAGGRYVLFRKYENEWHSVAEQSTWVS